MSDYSTRMRTCKKCGVEKPLQQFPLYRDEKGREGHRHRCDDCQKAYHKAFYAAGRKKIRDRTKEAYHTKRKFWLKTPEGIAWKRADQRRQCRKDRARVLDFYGRQCTCCNETIERFLTIDHMDGDGARHRKSLRPSDRSAFNRWLIRNKFPAGFQVLCFNCNIGKALNGGICPHKEGSSTITQVSTVKRPEAPSPSE